MQTISKTGGRWLALSDTLLNLPTPPSTESFAHIKAEAGALLIFVQKGLDQVPQRPTPSWCLSLYTHLELLTDIVASGLFPSAVSSVQHLLVHVQRLPLEEILPLSNSLAVLTSRCLAVVNFQQSSTMPFTIYFNPTIRCALSFEETLPRALEYHTALHMNKRPWSLPRISNSTPSFADYLHRLFCSFKASLTATVASDLQHALHHGSPNLYDVHSLRFLQKNCSVSMRHMVHGSARWSIDVVLLVERNEEVENNSTANTSHASSSSNNNSVNNNNNTNTNTNTNNNVNTNRPLAMTYVPTQTQKNSTRSEDEPEEMDLDDPERMQEAHNTNIEHTSKEEEERTEWQRMMQESGSGMGYGLLVWSMTSSLDGLRGIKIQQCLYHGISERKKVVVEVHGKVTEGFVAWWESKQKATPKSMYLMDPRTCGTDAVLRVLEGVAVQGAKDERASTKNNKRSLLRDQTYLGNFLEVFWSPTEPATILGWSY